jgi:isopentenyldiphosphate isomerase
MFPEQPTFAQDPDELFDVVNEDGSPTGIVKRRADVHRDGDWHRAIHVWLHGERDGVPFLLLNLRSRDKDTWPLRLDVTVGGHLAAGEDTSHAYREIHEEIGIEADPWRLLFIGRRKAIGQTERELQDVFLYRDDRPLDAYAPNPAELAGLVELPVASALDLFSERVPTADALLLDATTRATGPYSVDETNLLPARYFDYYRWIAESIDAVHRGTSPGALAPPVDDRENA